VEDSVRPKLITTASYESTINHSEMVNELPTLVSKLYCILTLFPLKKIGPSIFSLVKRLIENYGEYFRIDNCDNKNYIPKELIELVGSGVGEWLCDDDPVGTDDDG